MIDSLDGAMSTSTPVPTRTSSRRVKPNPNFSPQPGIAKTIGERTRAVSMPSPARTPMKDWGTLLEGKVSQLEARVTRTEEENENLRKEVAQLKKRLEEEEECRRKLEEKLRVIVEVDDEERGKIRTEFEKEKERRKKWEEEKIKEVKDDFKKVVLTEEKNSEEKRKQLKEGLEKELKEAVGKLSTETSKERPEETVGAGTVEDNAPKYQCIVITDSNGERATQETIRNHIPQGQREKYEIRVVVAYRLEDAYDRVEEGSLNVENAYVIIDNVTNNIRGGKKHYPEPPDLVSDRVAALRELILANSAKAVVVCELKPMKRVDVRYHSLRIHNYLVSCGKGGFGCRTQIRMRYLRDDGFHIQPKFDSIVDRTYACALLGIHVPDPTPFDDLTPEYERRRWDKQYPRLGGRGQPKS